MPPLISIKPSAYVRPDRDRDPVHWKKTNGGVRDHMKPLELGINYGMGVPSLARGLNRHPLIASKLARSARASLQGSRT